MKRRNYLLVFGSGLAFLVIACLLIGGFLQIRHYLRSLASRPLVLIQTPGNQERVSVDNGVVVHASARSQAGVRRIELWVDDRLLAAHDSAAEGGAPSLSLQANWLAEGAGAHVLVARAISSDYVSGQSSVSVEVLEASKAATTHIVAEGETLEAIAAQTGREAGDLLAANPDLGEGELQPGDQVEVPGGLGPGEAEEAPGGRAEPELPEGVAPPEPDPDEPEFLPGVEEVTGDEGLSPEPVNLRLEVLDLQSSSTYESLHCYLSLGEAEPRWFPDTDGDQGTDESFVSSGGTAWDVGEYMAGSAAPIVPWPGDAILPVDIACVGVAGGGTEAIELGNIAMRVPPEAWDGITRRADSLGGEGSFAIRYRIIRMFGSGVFFVFEDPTMTPPTNLRIEERRAFGGALVMTVLQWDYVPRPDELPIDGFRVYLNNNLQWVVDADQLATTIPDQWLLPPCGESYRLTVTAFRGAYPDGPESVHSAPVEMNTPEDDPACKRQVMVSITKLKTFELGGDGDHDVGDVGPIYGSFAINDQVYGFDGRCEGSGICGEVGLDHNSEYDLSRFPWGGQGAPLGVIVELEPGFGVGVDVSISEMDTGWHNEDEDVCIGGAATLDTDTPGEHTFLTRFGQGLCEVTYTTEPVGDRPVVDPGDPAPLPLLRVKSLTTLPGSDRLRVEVTNEGGADWSYQDLELSIRRRGGEQVASQTWSSFHLPVGATTVLEPDVSVTTNVEDYCATPDPNNAVAEQGQGGDFHFFTYCPPLPDLIISDVQYQSARELLLVRIYNSSLTPITDRSLTLQAYLPDGTPLFSGATEIHERNLAPHTSTLVQWGGFTPEQRLRMAAGYRVVVDPGDLIGENDETNNEFVFEGSHRLRVRWWGISTHYYPYRYNSESPQEQTFSTEVHAGSATGREVASWSFGPVEVEHGERYITAVESTNEVEVEVFGDEWLSLLVRTNMHYRVYDEFLGYAQMAFSAEDDWGVTKSIEVGETCDPDPIFYPYQTLTYHTVPPWQHCPPIQFSFMICRVE